MSAKLLLCAVISLFLPAVALAGGNGKYRSAAGPACASAVTAPASSTMAHAAAPRDTDTATSPIRSYRRYSYEPTQGGTRSFGSSGSRGGVRGVRDAASKMQWRYGN